MASTSSQDEFAKWAKLKRQLESHMASMEILGQTINKERLQFSVKGKTLLYVCIYGIQASTQLWYRKTPVFYLPTGFPWLIQWVFALPANPLGIFIPITSSNI